MSRARRLLAPMVAASCIAVAALPAAASANFFFPPFHVPAPQPNPPGSIPYTGGYGSPYIQPGQPGQVGSPCSPLAAFLHKC